MKPRHSLFVAVVGVLHTLCLITGACAIDAVAPLHDKTLVAWVAPANLSQRGGSALTIEDGNAHFDGIVFGERSPARWMAGSDNFRRTALEQAGWPAETASADTLVQIAIAYRGEEITVYRNGMEYSRHPIRELQPFDAESIVIIGQRHLRNGDFFMGAVEDARIYDRALTAAEIAALQPNVEGETRPWAWWPFDDTAAKDKSGRFAHVRLVGGAKVEQGRLLLAEDGGALYAATRAERLPSAIMLPKSTLSDTVPEEMVLHYHLMHPGGDSAPADPNAAFYLDGTYHLHYILAHPWRGKDSFSFIHVTSPDMVHWTWQPTKLQPAFTGHGMFSGTGFVTKEGRPAVVYHGQGAGQNQIAIAKDRALSTWEKPYVIEVKDAAGKPVNLPQGDPDLFLIGDTYYAIAARFGGTDNMPLIKSQDLKNWTYVGDFLRAFPADVIVGEDNSCANFFPLGDKWMLLTISHLLGCRYYIGEWDAAAEQFVPERHGRMNWRREDDPVGEIWEDFFAPETVLTPDGRRVMWAWLATPSGRSAVIRGRSIQSLPRELSLAADGVLRIKPLRELESLRADPVVKENVVIPNGAPPPFGTAVWQPLAQLPADAAEIRLTVPRDQAARKRFGFRLFGEGQAGGLPIILRPETGTIRVGTTEAPFAVADLPPGEDLDLRIFVDKYVVEVFANDRQAVVATHMDWTGKAGLDGYSSGAPTTIRRLETWKLESALEGFREAQANRNWEPRTQ
jgi:beta-fructofuranosidase